MLMVFPGGRDEVRERKNVLVEAKPDDSQGSQYPSTQQLFGGDSS